MFSYIIQFLLGVALLYYGSDFFINGSKAVSLKFNISSIIIGITLVAFGTSLPELIVSIIANLKGESGMVVGNVIGSNIANIGLVLAITAFLSPIYLSFNKISFDLYFLICVTLVSLLFIFSGTLFFWQGLLLLLLLCIYCWHLVIRNNFPDKKESDHANLVGFSIFTNILLGITGLGFGAHLIVISAKGIAILLGFSSLVIGMSIVAVGTSLPELAASLASTKHGESGFVIGNIIGSNIMNIVIVLGFTILLRPISVDFSDIFFQGLIMIIITLVLLLLFKFKGGVSKLSSVMFMLIYLLFIYINFQ